MQYTDTNLTLTENFESCKLEAYQDIKGIWTIAYGHTLLVFPGMTCTQEQANQWLAEDVHSAEACVNTNVTFEINQQEFNALVDFVFNVGNGAFKQTTMLRLLNQGDIEGAANEFERWQFADGKPVAGLLRRRIAEKQEFES